MSSVQEAALTAGRIVGSIALFLGTLWVAAMVSLLGLLGGCGVSANGSDPDYTGAAAALCEQDRLSSDIAVHAIFIIPGLLIMAAQMAYWKGAGAVATALTAATVVPGALMLLVAGGGG